MHLARSLIKIRIFFTFRKSKMQVKYNDIGTFFSSLFIFSYILLLWYSPLTYGHRTKIQHEHRHDKIYQVWYKDTENNILLYKCS